MDNQFDLTHIKLVGMPDGVMDELLRVPDNFEHILDNIFDDDETLPEMETCPIVSTYDGVSNFGDWEETDIKEDIVKAPEFDISYEGITRETDSI